MVHENGKCKLIGAELKNFSQRLVVFRVKDWEICEEFANVGRDRSISLRKVGNQVKSLFDLEFKRFITPSIIKIVYILVMILLAIGYIGLVVTSFQADAMLGFLMFLIVGPLFVLIYLVMVRAGLESLIAQIRTAENTAELVRLAGGTPPADSGPRPFPGNPPAPQQPQDPTANGGHTPPANPYQK